MEHLFTATREKFHLPKAPDGGPLVYFCGHSLGPQPKATKEYILEELDLWASKGVEGHFEGEHPWYNYHETVVKGLSKWCGAQTYEVVAMNSLTTNIHLLMATFYKPKGRKNKIAIEPKSFASDIYAITSQGEWHGISNGENLLEIPFSDTYISTTEDILAFIDHHQEELSLVWMGAINYVTGQRYDIEKITSHAHSYGILVGFDLAHAIGNIELKLHEWNVDFAAWCSYKYLNASPGGVGGIFIHEKWAIPSTPRLSGWWGTSPESRFLMDKIFVAQPGAAGWQLSNAPILSLAALRASLQIIDSIPLETIFNQRDTLFEALYIGLEQAKSTSEYTIITPKKAHGAQISILTNGLAPEIQDFLKSKDIIVDNRGYDIIRISANPLYNNIFEVNNFLDNWKQFWF